jgi:hypothetical protein
MGEIRPYLPVKLIIGFIFSDQTYLDKARRVLEKRFGRSDLKSQTLSFIHTDYYEKELGKDLKRKFFSFQRLICASDLPKIKIFTNGLETRLSQDSKRKINIDPGYLELSKLVLASTKNYKHRIYQERGIFAEATLYYQNNSYMGWEWTYPDYKTKEYIEIFNQIREIYQQQIQGIG